MPGELFVPLRGKNFDGHGFLADVVAKGVSVILADTGYLKNILCRIMYPVLRSRTPCRP